MDSVQKFLKIPQVNYLKLLRLVQSVLNVTFVSAAARCATVAFSTTCAVHIEDCEGWWLSGCCSSVAEHWQLKPEVSWV